MKVFKLLPLVILVSTPAFANVDPKIAEFCLKATDFAGCVQTMTGGLPPKQQQDAEEGLRTWTRDDGTIIRFRPTTVAALKHDGKYGRYIEYQYGLEDKNYNVMWGVQADCIDYTANWDQDSAGWFKVKDPNMYLRPGENWTKFNSSKEAKAVLDEFCPVINTLPKSDTPIE